MSAAVHRDNKKRIVFRKPGKAQATDLAQPLNMKESVILLMDVDLDCEENEVKAAAWHGCSVLTMRTTREAFRTIRDQGSGLDAMVVDLDPGAHVSPLSDCRQ